MSSTPGKRTDTLVLGDWCIRLELDRRDRLRLEAKHRHQLLLRFTPGEQDGEDWRGHLGSDDGRPLPPSSGPQETVVVLGGWCLHGWLDERQQLQWAIKHSPGQRPYGERPIPVDPGRQGWQCTLTTAVLETARP